MQWYERFFLNPGPVGNAQQVAKADATRVMLAFTSNGVFSTRLSTSNQPATNQGITLPTQTVSMVMTLRDWGLIVQQDWFFISQGLLGENVTVYEMLADTPAEIELATFGAVMAGATLRGGDWATPAPAVSFDPASNPLDRLAQKVKGAIWRLSQQRN